MCFGRAEGTGIEAMFTGIAVAFLATAPPFSLCLGCSHFLRSLTCGIQFVRVAHKLQIEVNMNSLFGQGENVTGTLPLTLIKAGKSEQVVGLALFKKLEVVAPTKRQSSHIVTNNKHRYFIICWENNRTP